MSKAKQDIIKHLYDKGIIKDKTTLNQYFLTFDDFINKSKNKQNPFTKTKPYNDTSEVNFHRTKELSTNYKYLDSSSKILSVIKSEKLYLIPTLNLDYLSKKFNLNSTYISKKINQSQNPSFKDYINFLRVKEAEQMLKNKKYDNYTIMAIALECGFNSRSAFYSAFKKQNNTTPKAYRNQ